MGERAARECRSLEAALDLHRTGLLADAAAAYERILAATPGDGLVARCCALAWLALGRGARASELLASPAGLNVGDAQALFELGNAQHLSGRVEEALSTYEQIVRAFPAFPEALNNLGFALTRAGRTAEAVDCLHRAVLVRPGFAEAHYNLGDALLRQEDLEAARSAFESGLRLRHDFPSLYKLTQVSLRLGDAAAVVEACDACLERSPGMSGALALKALALEEGGDEASARWLVDFERFLRAEKVRPRGGSVSLASFHDELLLAARAHASLDRDPSYSNIRRGSRTQDLFQAPTGAWADLAGIVQAAVRGYVERLVADDAHPFAVHRPQRYRITAWANFLERGGHFHPHIHSSWLSGAYYTHLARSESDDPEREGWIEFGTPDPALRGRAEPRTRVVRPEPGLLLLFPSYFYHRTIPLESAEERVSIAFNVYSAV